MQSLQLPEMNIASIPPIPATLAAASATARDAAAEVAKIRQALRDAQTDASKSEAKHQVSANSLEKAEAQSALGGTAQQLEETRAVFRGTRDGLDFSRMRVAGLSARLQEALSIETAALTDLKREWKDFCFQLSKDIEDKYSDLAGKLTSLIDRGIAFALTTGNNRLYGRLLRAGNALVDVREQEDVRMSRRGSLSWKNVWREDPAALAIHEEIEATRQRLFLGIGIPEELKPIASE